MTRSIRKGMHRPILATLLGGFLLLLGFGCCGPPQTDDDPTLRFVHISDPHVFHVGKGQRTTEAEPNEDQDSKQDEVVKPLAVSEADENIAAFWAAMDAIASIQEELTGEPANGGRPNGCGSVPRRSKHRGIDAAVITGDLEIESLVTIPGLETTIDLPHDRKVVIDADTPQGRLEQGAKYFARMLRVSGVETWFVIPGNNDLIDEVPQTIESYREFVRLVNRASCGRFELVDLSEQTREINGFSFVGIDNSSFKNQHSGARARAFRTIQLQKIEELEARLCAGCRIRSETLLFYHVPWLEDPYIKEQWKDLTPKDPSKHKRNECDVEGHDEAAPGSDKNHSAWCVTKEVRQAWRDLFRDHQVTAAFSGHFHSSKKSEYLKEDRTVLFGAQVPTSVPLLLAPPLSVKVQYPGTEDGEKNRPLAAAGGTFQGYKLGPDPSTASFHEDASARGFQLIEFVRDADGTVEEPTRTMYWLQNAQRPPDDRSSGERGAGESRITETVEEVSETTETTKVTGDPASAEGATSVTTRTTVTNRTIQRTIPPDASNASGSSGTQPATGAAGADDAPGDASGDAADDAADTPDAEASEGAPDAAEDPATPPPNDG